jgi:hypothetical protein
MRDIPRRLSPQEIDERAAEARNIIASPFFQMMFAELEQEYVNQLIQADVGELTASTAHASIKVLAHVKSKLQSYIDDVALRNRTQRVIR